MHAWFNHFLCSKPNLRRVPTFIIWYIIITAKKKIFFFVQLSDHLKFNSISVEADTGWLTPLILHPNGPADCNSVRYCKIKILTFGVSIRCSWMSTSECTNVYQIHVIYWTHSQSDSVLYRTDTEHTKKRRNKFQQSSKIDWYNCGFQQKRKH